MGKIKEKICRGEIFVLILSPILGFKLACRTEKCIKNIPRSVNKFQVLRGISTEPLVQCSRYFTTSLKPLLMLRVVV
jgi:hypothetical protein